MSEAGLISKLGQVVGKGNVLGDAADIGRYGTDATGVTGPPGGAVVPYVVVLPRDTSEVAAVVGIALEEGLPVVPRGGGTGLWGGAVPLMGGIVVSTERMNDGVEIHREDLYAVACAGVITSDLARQVEARGLFYPIDPASEMLSTIGGNVGDGAVGMHGLKYGVTRNYVLGLEMVTPEGKVLKVGARTVKSVAGYDLTRLMVGARGTLGIVTSVTLKILPMPEERRALVFAFPEGPRAAAAAVEIMSEGFDPAALEIADEVTMTACQGFLEGSLGVSWDAELLIEFHGTKSLCEGEISRVKEMMEAHFGLRATREARYPEAERLWKARRAALTALASTSPTVIVKDLALPRGRTEGMLREIAEVARRHQTRIAVFGHAGAGLLHAAVLSDGPRDDAAEKIGAAIAELTGACVNAGGVVSGERGIGLARAPAPAAVPSEAGREVLRALKKSTDPKGIMNPGKLLHES